MFFVLGGVEQLQRNFLGDVEFILAFGADLSVVVGALARDFIGVVDCAHIGLSGEGFVDIKGIAKVVHWHDRMSGYGGLKHMACRKYCGSIRNE